MTSKFAFTDPTKIAEEAERIYHESLKEELEELSQGQYVAIDVLSGHHYVGEYAEVALIKAREESPYGVFHLIKIGGTTALGARQIGQHGPNWDWTLRPTR